MCGILFFTGDDALNSDHPSLESIKHRGPDNVDVKHFTFNTKFITLGHRRLSIIELSDNGNQPMNYEKSDFWITFNGEIYNYKDLRSDLKKKGYLFNTNSDTEVLLVSYYHWGVDCLNYLNGMFSFVIWDNTKKKVFAARDRFGIKPMYYWNDKSGFGISSEIKQLSYLKGFKKHMNTNVAYQFLQYGDFAYNSETLWNDVFEIEPGHYLSIDYNNWNLGEKFDVIKWYDLEFNFSNKTQLSSKLVFKNFINLFKQSLKIRLNADVELGALVSGGLDSSSIVSFLHEIKPKHKTQTFSMVYNESEYSEKLFIDSLVKDLNLKSKIITFEFSDYFLDLDKIIWHNDLPTVGRSIVPHFNIYKNIDSSKYKVILEGQGADEYMAGYGNFHLAYLCELLNRFKLISFCKEYFKFQKTRKGSFITDVKAILQYNYPNLYRRFKRSSNYDNMFSFDKVIKEQSINREQNNIKSIFQNRFKVLRSILHSVDRISMSNSIETRVPFLDHTLIEYVTSLPFSYLIKNGVRKHILRESMKEYLPVSIYNRQEKVGFSSPEDVWFLNQLKSSFVKEVESAIELPFVNESEVRLKLDNFLNKKTKVDKSLIRLINLNRWIKIFDIKI